MLLDVPHVFLLLVIYQLKHFVADFPLQTPYMLGKFNKKRWVKPLAAHAGVHAALTFAIILGVAPSPLKLILLPLLDFVCHFTMDRVKASPNLLGRYKGLSADEYRNAKRGAEMPLSNEELRMHIKNCIARIRSNKLYYWALGFDQMVHHLTHYLLIYLILR